MIALDSNFIIHVMVSSSGSHKDALNALEHLDDDLCTTPTNTGEVLRLLTHPKIFASPLKIEKAVAALTDFTECHRIRTLDESPDWWRELPSLTKQIPGLKGNEIFDARIALCLKHHKVKRIVTQDSDFKKYSFLSPILY